jgi:hypothetical protein
MKKLSLSVSSLFLLLGVSAAADSAGTTELLSLQTSPSFSFSLKLAAVGTCNTVLHAKKVQTTDHLEIVISRAEEGRMFCFLPEAVVQTVPVSFADSRESQQKITITTSANIKLLSLEL